MSHRCIYTKDGKQCNFYLPDDWPLPLCPWHFAGPAALAIGAAIGIGAVVAAKAVPNLLKKLGGKKKQDKDNSDVVELLEPSEPENLILTQQLTKPSFQQVKRHRSTPE